MESQEPAQREIATSPERQRESYLLRQADSSPISIEYQKEAPSKKWVREEGIRKQITTGVESANIRLEEQLPPKSIVKLPFSEDQTLYFEVTDPLVSRDRTRFPNSIWLEMIDIQESDFKNLSEKRPSFTLSTLPLDDATREKLGIQKPPVEETIPNEVKEKLTEDLKGMEGMTPTPPSNVSKEDVQKIINKMENSPEEKSFKTRPGRQIDPERLKQSLDRAEDKGWERPKTAQGPQAEHFEAKGGAEILKRAQKENERLEKEREALREERIKDLKRRIAERKRELAERQRQETYGVPEEAKSYVPESQRPRDVRAQARKESESPRTQPTPTSKKGFFARLFGR